MDITITISEQDKKILESGMADIKAWLENAVKAKVRSQLAVVMRSEHKVVVSTEKVNEYIKSFTEKAKSA